NIVDQNGVKSYVVIQPEDRRCDLEPNHTHFLLFDDGDVKADNVLNQRGEIEKYSRRIEIDNEKTKDIEQSIKEYGRVPIVMVLVEGGPSSIKTICKALESGTPLVVIKESGRAADLIADILAILLTDNNVENERPKTAAKTNNKSDEISQLVDNADWLKEAEEVKEELCKTLRERKMLVTIFKFDSVKHHGNLEDAILEALFNAAKFAEVDDEQHLRLAKLKLTMEEDLHTALMDALRRGLVNFVELLCEFGASLEKITEKNLGQLYAFGITQYNDHLPLKDEQGKIKNSYYNQYLRNFIQGTNTETMLGKNAPRDLFLWAIFLNRLELAKYLCSKTWNQSVAPLFGAKIYRLAVKSTLDPDKQEKYENYAMQFDTYANALIDTCFDNDENFAVDILKRPAQALFNVDVLKLALDADCRSFLASRTVQKYLDNKWYGNINYKRPWINFKIFFVVFLILFSFVLLVDYFPLNIYNEKRSGIKSLQIPITEMFLHICIWSLILEEIRQFVLTDNYSDYFEELWNIFDLTAFALYLIGFITRFIVNETLFAISKIFLCLDLIVWFVRTLHLFAAYEKLGPKLIMIYNTMKDLLFFVCFILIFLFAFSITSWSLITTTVQVNWIYTDDGKLFNATVLNAGSGLWTWRYLRDVTNHGIWKVFGQVDPFDGNDPYNDVAWVLAIIFVTVSNVLLLNVLVALFNVTIQKVQGKSHSLWRYQRFLIVNEYSKKTPLPPPFNTFYYVFTIIRWLFRQIHLCRRHVTASIDNIPLKIRTQTLVNEPKITDFMQRESAIAEDYWRYTLRHEEKSRTEITLESLEQKLEELKTRVQQIGNVSHSNSITYSVDYFYI
ncbi:unnamed protein product, partial [Didymodactylos carnosus]